MSASIPYRVISAFIWIVFFIISPFSAFSAEKSISILYFFSATCPHCKQTTPVVSELSRAYNVQGILFGKENPGPLPFPVKKGTRADKDRYQLPGVPSLVVLRNGSFKQAIIGELGIRDAKPLVKAFQSGALAVSEALEKMPHGEVLITGWVNNLGGYFQKDAKFFLTDRRRNLPVNPWLPLEAVKSKFKKARPRLMSDVLGKPVLLRGKVVKTEAGPRFEVVEDVKIE